MSLDQTNIIPRLLLCMPVSEQSELLKSIGLCQGFKVKQIETGWLSALESFAQNNLRPEQPVLVFIELTELNRKRVNLRHLCETLHRCSGQVQVVVSAANIVHLTPAQIELARVWGAAGFIPSLSKRRIKIQLRDTTGIQLQRLMTQLDVGHIKIERLQSFISTLPEGIGRSKEVQNQHMVLAHLEANDITLPQVEQWARSGAGFNVADRVWHMRSFNQTFLGNEANAALAKRFALDANGAQIVGQLLQSAGAFDHVTFDHGFENAELFYRFGETRALTALSLKKVLEVLKSDVRALDRRYLGKVYPSSFLGAEGADVVAKHFSVPHDTAVRWVAQLVTLGLVEHVTQEHRFKPTENFYHFCGMAKERELVVSESTAPVSIPVFAPSGF